MNIIELLLISLTLSTEAFVIGLNTFIICLIDYDLGNLFHKKTHQYSNIIGGITLIILGIKSLISLL